MDDNTKKPKKQYKKRSFDAIKTGNLTDLQESININADLNTSLERIRGRARQLANNNPVVVRFLQLLQDNVIGSTGISLNCQIRNPNGQLDSNPNQLIEEAWQDFCKHGNCTTDGTMSFTGLCKLLVSSIHRDGEVFIIKRYSREFKHGFALDIIPIEHLSNTFNGMASNKNLIWQSVELNQYLRPVAYWINDAPQNDYAVVQGSTHAANYKRIPAEDCLHLFKPNSIGQIRGLSALACTILSLHHIDAYKTSELEMARLSSLKKVFLTLPPDPDGIAQEDIDALGNVNKTLEAGEIEALPQGASVTAIDWNSPANGFPEFIKAQMKSIASGLGVSYTSLANDLENVNFSSSKYAALADSIVYENFQSWFIESFIDKVYQSWLQVKLTDPAFPLPSTKYSKYLNVKWISRGLKSVNLLETTKAMLLLDSLGVVSKSQICSELTGLDFNDVALQRAAEEKMLDSLGLKLVSAIDILKLEATINPPTAEK